MSFFAVLLALLLEQLKPLPRDNRVHQTLASWVRWTGRNFDAGQPHHTWVVWCVSVLVSSLLAAGLYLAIAHYSLLLGLAFDVLLLCLRAQTKEGKESRERFVPVLNLPGDFSPFLRHHQPAILLVFQIAQLIELLNHAGNGRLLHLE